MKRFLMLIMFVVLLAPLATLPSQAAPPEQSGADWPIPNGHFFTQAAPAGYG